MKNIEEQAEIFGVLSDPTRLKLLKLLCLQPETGALCVNALANVLKISQPAVSQHLKLLRSVGLVTGQRRGNLVHYHVNTANVACYRELLLTSLSVADAPKPQACEECKEGKR